jgi:tetratricopeptide (TPR) repeat protein
MRLFDLALAAVAESDDTGLIDTISALRATTIGWSGRAEEARATLEGIVARANLAPEVSHEVHHCLSSLALAQQDAPAALHHAERALHFLNVNKTVSVRTKAANIAQLGGACGLNHRTAEADEHFEAAVELFQRLGAGGSVQAGNVLNNWSVECERAGDARRALELVDRAIASSAAAASPYLVVNRARALELLGRWTEAERAFRQALELTEANHVQPVEQVAHAGLAWLALERGDIEAARRWHAVDANAPPVLAGKPGLLRAQVELRLALADGEETRILALARSLFDVRGPAAVTARLVTAAIHQRAGSADAAVAEAQEAVRVARRLQGDNRTSVRVGLAKEALAELLAAVGRRAESEREGREAVAILEQSVDPAHPRLARARARLGCAVVREAAE